MDDSVHNENSNNATEPAVGRDENHSPSSSSSETTLDNVKGAELPCRRYRRQSKAKRKRKWKPYTELSWDERKIQDDREAKRACAKRERLSAEGHPIAPYNTTQFLMEDHKTVPHSDQPLSNPGTAASSPGIIANDIDPEKTIGSLVPKEGNAVTNGIESPYPNGMQSDSKKGGAIRDEIQRYILQDFSHTYADLHAEQLQSMSKPELISECLKLEKKVESLERRVRDCKKRHSDEKRSLADVRLLEKINSLQSQNAQLAKENASIASSLKTSAAEPASIQAS